MGRASGGRLRGLLVIAMMGSIVGIGRTGLGGLYGRVGTLIREIIWRTIDMDSVRCAGQMVVGTRENGIGASSTATVK